MMMTVQYKHVKYPILSFQTVMAAFCPIRRWAILSTIDLLTFSGAC